MLVLAADTSLPILSVALIRDGALIGAIAMEGRGSRNEKMLPAIDWLLSENGIGSIAYVPLAQGLLTDRYLTDIPTDSRAAKSTGFLQESAVTYAFASPAMCLRPARR